MVYASLIRSFSYRLLKFFDKSNLVKKRQTLSDSYNEKKIPLVYPVSYEKLVI